MMLKNGIRTAHNKSLKKSYKLLNSQEKRIVKLYEAKELAHRFLYGYKGFFTTAQRLENGAVDFEKISSSDLDLFEMSNKQIERFNKIDDDLVDAALLKFKRTQFNYSQSF